MNATTELKSITSIRPCIIITFVSVLIIVIVSTEGFEAERKQVILDLPKRTDLNNYITSLKNIVEFGMRHKIYVDMNFEFGLFLINVNLQNILIMKSKTLPPEIRSQMEEVMTQNNILRNYYNDMVRKNGDEFSRTATTISTLFHNESNWPIYFEKLNTDLLQQTKFFTLNQLQSLFGKWEKYEEKLNDYSKYQPSLERSDECIAALADLNIVSSYKLKHPPLCNLPTQCKLSEGNTYGYGLSHRILLLILAHYARGCRLYSVEQDKKKLDTFCEWTFMESQYIAANDFQQPDLIMEQITLCALVGHAQFLRRSWINKLLEYQTSEGCFTEDLLIATGNLPMEEGRYDKWIIDANDKTIMNGRCNSHLSAVAASMLTMAIRYILENYF